MFLPVEQYDQLPDHCGQQMARVFSAPHVIEDMKPYRSPLDGSMVTSRSQHRDHMRKHGVIEVGNERLNRPYRKEYDPGDIKQDIADAIG